jgi:tetratricopeptide (TPR) repeat protein
MRQRLAVLLVFLVSGFGLEASTLKGLVLANQLGGPPVSKVRISAPGANPTETGESGSFTLEFPQAQPGDVVQVTVNKPGFVVVNYVQLRVVLPKNANAEVLTLLVCKEEQFEEWARQFYRLKSLDAIEETYKAQVKHLEESKQQTAAAMAKLQVERDQARAAAEKAADEVARLKPGDTSDLYAEAMSLFLNGKVPDALHVLDEQKLRKSIEDAEAAKAAEDKAIAKAVQGYLLKATHLTTQFQFADAEKVYESATLAAPDSEEAHLDFGLFSQLLDRLSVARREYQRALEISQRKGNQPIAEMVLNNLGILDHSENKEEASRQDYEQALKISRQLAQQSPGIYGPKIAVTLNNLGILDTKKRPEEARKYLEEALRRLCTSSRPTASLHRIEA